MVLLVHGGPWARDSWGYDGTHQWLANRGYAVLSVNFRGSTGFGKTLTNAGDKQWGAKMHDDLIDAVEWAVAEGITAADTVAIMGGSYGGYATLVGADLHPRDLRLRRGHRRAVEPGHPDRVDPAVLEAAARAVRQPDGRPAHRGGPGAARRRARR